MECDSVDFANNNDFQQVIPLIYKNFLHEHNPAAINPFCGRLQEYDIDHILEMLIIDKSSINLKTFTETIKISDFLASSNSDKIKIICDQLKNLIEKTSNLIGPDCLIIDVPIFSESYYLQLVTDTVNCIVHRKFLETLSFEKVVEACCFLRSGAFVVHSLALNNPVSHLPVISRLLTRFENVTENFRGHIEEILLRLCKDNFCLETHILDLVISLRRFPALALRLIASGSDWPARIRQVFCQDSATRHWLLSEMSDSVQLGVIQRNVLYALEHSSLRRRALIDVLSALGNSYEERALDVILARVEDDYETVLSVLSWVHCNADLINSDAHTAKLADWVQFQILLPGRITISLLLLSLVINSRHMESFEKNVFSVLGIPASNKTRKMRVLMFSQFNKARESVLNILRCLGNVPWAGIEDSSRLLVCLHSVASSPLEETDLGFVGRALLLAISSAVYRDSADIVELVEFFVELDFKQTPLRRRIIPALNVFMDLFNVVRSQVENVEISLFRQILIIFFVMLTYSYVREFMDASHFPSVSDVQAVLQYMPVRLLLWHAASRQQQLASLYPSLLRLVVIHFPYYCSVDDWLRGESRVKYVVADEIFERFSDLSSPRSLDDQKISVFVNSMLSCGDDELTELSSTWWDLHFIYPRLTILTLNAWLPGRGVKEMPKDPLLLFESSPVVFSKCALLEIFMNILDITLKQASLEMIQDSQSNERNRTNHMRLLSDTFLFAQDCCAYVNLLGLIIRPFPGKDELFGLEIAERRSQLICAYLHRIFLRNRDILQMIHFQTYPLSIVPVTCRLIPSMHVCFDFLPSLISHVQIERHIFGVHLLAELCGKYHIALAFKVAKIALDIVALNYADLIPAERNHYILALVDPICEVAISHKSLIPSVVDFLVHVARGCHCMVVSKCFVFADVGRCVRARGIRTDTISSVLYYRIISSVSKLVNKCDFNALSTGFV